MSNQAEDDHVSESPTNQNEMNQIMPTILNDCEIDANKSNIESIDQNAIKIDSNFELLQTIPLEIPKESNAVDCILPVGEPELIDSLDQLRSILRLDSKQFEQLEAWLSRETQNVEQKFEQHLTDLIKEKNVLQEKLMIAYEDKQRQAVESDKLINEIKTEWNQKLEKANRLADARKRELESMVVKYAMSENQIIAAKNKKDEYEKKCRDALKDKDSLMMRIKGLSNEKVLLVTQIDQKSADLVSNAKEMDKYRLQMKEKDAQLIQATFSLQQEQEALRECKAKLQESEQTVEGLRNEIESLRQQTEIEVKTSDAVQRLEAQLLQERNAFQSKVTHLESENDLCLTKIQKLDQEKLSVHEQLDRNKRLVNKFQQDLEDYEQCKQTLVETRQALQRLQHDHDACREIVKRLEEDNVELQKEMDSCRQKEGELLEFTERLQSKTVNLQSEHILLQQKHSKETVELNELRAKCKHLEQSSKSLNDQLVEMAREAEQRKSEVENLKQQLEQHLQSQSKLKEELENENRVLRKRHVQNVKELNKELQGLRRKLEWTEADSSSQADASSICSRANSITSLEKTGVATSSTSNSNTLVSNGESVEENGLCLSNSTVITVSNSKAEADPIIQVDKQKLIQKIVSLQKMIVKKRERIEFLEEHNNQLTEEMKKKTRIIQNYILREEAGALTTNDMDTYKEQFSRHNTGIMSSLYKNTTSDSAMTLQFSLEINRKLQAVLEDTLLKNITLKENIATLGNEIARITNDPK